VVKDDERSEERNGTTRKRPPTLAERGVGTGANVSAGCPNRGHGADTQTARRARHFQVPPSGPSLLTAAAFDDRQTACDTESVTTAPPTDDEIIGALRSLHDRYLAAASSELLVTVDSFLHYGETDADLTGLLRRDPVIAGYLALDQPMLNVAAGGIGYDLRAAIAVFLRTAQAGERPFGDEAERLLRAIRLTDGVVPVRVRTVLLDFSFEEPVALPFGQLSPATRSELALSEASEAAPPASVFETVVDAPAIVGGAGRDPWTAAEREQAELALTEAADEPLGRLMVSLACSYANPVQERMVWIGALYSGSQVGHGAIPIGSAWTSGPGMGYPTLELDRLIQAAAVVARVPDITRIAIAARRYFQAITERVRPADSLIDYAIAIEAITQTSQGKEQRHRLVALIGAGVPELGIDNATDFKLVKDTRNDIVHSRRRPTNVAGVASVARRLVDHAITSAVREAVAARSQGPDQSAG